MVQELEQPEWRHMQARDIARVTAVANVVHADFFEDEAVFRDRFMLYPDGCFVLERGNEILGYGVSYPWQLDTVPALNAVLGELPEARSGGNATRVVELMAAQAETDGFATMSLVAVSGSQGFWEKKGFVARDLPQLAGKLKTYSDGALYMVRAG